MASETVSLNQGHATLTFSGHWSPMLQGQRVVGLYLSGQGDLSYTSTFEPERPVFLKNLKEWSSVHPVTTDKGVTVSVPFKEARLFLGGMPLPAWAALEEAASLDAASKAFQQRWNKLDRHVPLHLMALQAANAPEKQAAVMELEDGNDRWVYTYDGVDAMEETLQSAVRFSDLHGGVFNPDLAQWRNLVDLSRQALGWNPRKGLAPNPFLLSALDVDLRTRDNRNADMIVQETITPLVDGLRVLRFELLSTLVTEKDTRHLRVARVTDGHGHSFAFSHTHDRLAVWLSAPTTKGLPFTLRMEYSGDFLYQPGENSYWQLGVRESWYPIPENLAGESYTFHGTIRTSGDWIAFLPGDTIRREKDGPWNLVETK
jgi:hypothetical protein